MTEPAPRTLPAWRLLTGVALVSAATLHLEILQTRIFSLVLWHHVTYLVVTFTLLGFAASGTLLSLLGERPARAPARFLALGSLAFALTTLGAFALLARSPIDTLELLQHRSQYLWVFACYLYLVVPFLCAGLVIGASLQLAGPRTGLVYGVNLVGSAAGCLLFVPLLLQWGGGGSILVAAVVAGLAAVAFAGPRSPLSWIVVVLLLTAKFTLAGGGADALLPLAAAPSKPVALLVADAQRHGVPGAGIEASFWDPICHIDVVNFGDARGIRRVFQDGDAPTEILPAAAAFDPAQVYALPYVVGNAARAARAADPTAPERPEVLVIGIGGGPDLRQAVWNGARKVTGVEINASTVAMMTSDELRGQRGYRTFSGDVYHLPGVEVVNGEGRSYVRRSPGKYDLIQMTGTDTYTALASGSCVLSESYLYTLEAFADYFDHLKPGGMVSILRFRFFPPRESLRLVSIGVEALRRRGVAHPEQCVLVVDRVLSVRDFGQPLRKETLAWSAVMFKETPFTPAEVEATRTWIAANPANAPMRGGAPAVFSLACAPGEPAKNEFGEYLAAVAAGRDAEFRAAYPYRIDPVDDDSPFFFRYHRWRSLLQPQERTNYFSMTGRDPVGLFLLLTALLESALLVALLVLLPLALARRTRLPRTGRAPVLLHFLGLGAGYLLLEVAAMQRLVLYLGHPTRSITVVLFSFLLFSGLGAAVAGRLRLASARAPLVAIVVLTGACALGLPPVLRATLGWELAPRIVFASALLAPPAFLMGMPFPTALARLRGDLGPFLPWAFAINGGASVVASVVAILVAMDGGFGAVFGLAAVAYLLAWWTARRLPEPAAT